MAVAHVGLQPRGSMRLRILLCLYELAQGGKPATYRDVQARLGISAGSASHHIGQLAKSGHILRHGRARTLSLSPLALAELIQGEWLTPSHTVSLSLSTAAVELLELQSEDEDVQS